MAEENKIPSVKKSKSPLYISLGMLTALVAVYFFVPSVREFLQEAWRVLSSGDEERIEKWVSRFGLYGPLMIVLAKILQFFLFVIPTIAMIVVAIRAYGPTYGSLIVVAAIFSAASVAYTLGAYFGPAILEKLVGGKTQELMLGLITDYGFWAVVITRVNPLFSSDAISFTAGVLKMHYWKFIGATLGGAIPLTVFVALIGRDNETLISGLIWGSVISIISLVAYVWWDRKKKKQKKHKDRN
jgi:uncharacterized membrane protein YdjX (TVP38/TMEM64 family)